MSDRKTYIISKNNKRIAKNTMFLYFRMGFILIVSLFSTRVVLQALGVVDYGIYNVVSGFVTMFAFLNTSMSNGVQRFYNFSLGRKNDYSITEVYNTSLQIQVILAVILFVLLETVGLWYMYNEMVIPEDRVNSALWVFHFSVLSLLVIVMQIPYSAAIIAYERMDYYAYVSIFDVLAKLGIAYAIKLSDSDRLVLYGLLNFIVTSIGFVLYYLYAKHQFRDLKTVFRVKKDLFKPMLSFSGWNVFGSFAYMLKSQGLNMLLNVFFGPVVNAARGISAMVMSGVQGFQANIVIAFRPQLVQSYASGDNDRVLKLFYTLSKVSFILLAMLSLPLIMEIDYVLHLWIGNNIPAYTSAFTILVLINMVISSLNTPISQVVHATGKMKTYQLGTSLIVCSILPISWLVLKIGLDPTSVYWVSLIVCLFNQVICNMLLKQVFPYSIMDYCKNVVLPCIVYSFIVSMTLYFTVKFLSPSFFRFILTGTLSVVMTAIVSYLFVLNKKEKESLLCYIKRNRR